MVRVKERERERERESDIMEGKRKGGKVRGERERGGGR